MCKVQLAVFISLSQVAASVLDTIVSKFLFRYDNKNSLEIRKAHPLFYYISISGKTNLNIFSYVGRLRCIVQYCYCKVL